MDLTNLNDPQIIAEQYKYTIWLRFQSLTRAEQRITKNVLPSLLGISPRTFELWMYYKKEDSKTIPADMLYRLASFFGCDINEMWTEAPESIHLEYIKMKNRAKELLAG